MSLKSQPIITFPASNQNEVALTQQGAQNNFVLLNGVLSSVATVSAITNTQNIAPPISTNPVSAIITRKVSFISNGYSRNICITSGGDLSGVTFVVTGTQNGCGVTENITGPNNNTVEGASLFDTIESIQITNANADQDFNIGSGLIAMSRPLRTNWDNPNFNLVAYGLTVCNPFGGNGNPSSFSVYWSQNMPYGVDMNVALSTDVLQATNGIITESDGLEDLIHVFKPIDVFIDTLLVKMTFGAYDQYGKVLFSQIGR